MKVIHTTDSPILLKIIPESSFDIFKNGQTSKSFIDMEIPHAIEKDGTLVINIDPNGDNDFRGIQEEMIVFQYLNVKENQDG